MKSVVFKRIAAFSALIIWLFVIFSFSQENASQSSERSAQVIDSVAETVVKEYKDYTPAQKTEFINNWQHIARKSAHFLEFVVLGVLTLLAMLTLPLSGRIRLAVSTVFCALCAVFDEFHQRFSEGRSPQFSDFLLDFAGALTGILITLAIILLVRAIIKKRVGSKNRALRKHSA